MRSRDRGTIQVEGYFIGDKHKERVNGYFGAIGKLFSKRSFQRLRFPRGDSLNIF